MQDAGIDVADPVLLRGRSWRWGRARIEGLMERPPAGYVRVPVDEKHERLETLWATRIQAALFGGNKAS